MSIRVRIAKWLAPELEDAAVFWERATDDQIKLRHRVQFENSTMKSTMLEYKIALRNIIALKTPKCAHAARRMADIAEAALSQPNLPTREEA